MRPYKAWRNSVRTASYFERATERATHMSDYQVMEQIELALYGSGQSISRFRQSTGETRDDQLRELRMYLEASLGMLEVITDRSGV
jgi:hypothetical protein